MTVHDDVISHVNISDVVSTDGGAYSCIASNSVGATQHAARLNVYGEQSSFSWGCEMSGQPVDVACTEDSCKSPIARESAGTDGEGGRRGLRQQTTCLKSDPIKSSMSRKVSRGERDVK